MTPDIILQRTGIDVRAVEQGDDAWHKLRLGVITASEVHNVIAKPRSGKKWPDMKMSYFHTLLAEVCTGVAPEVNAKALAWGKQYENDARALFEFTSGVNVTESPIIYRDESMRTACSPDGLCSDGNGLELNESALADMYFAATGDEPEWSNWFGFSDAVDAVVDRIADLEAKQPSPVVPEGLVKAVRFYEQVKRENPPVETEAWKDAIDWVLKESCQAVNIDTNGD